MVLSANQLKAIRQGIAIPITVEQTECVLVRRDLYEKYFVYDDSEIAIQEAYPLMDAVASKEGWGDASEDLYDDLLPKKP